MSQSKIEFRLGAIHFVGEGEKGWVTQQLDKIITKAPNLLRAAGTMEDEMTEDEYGTSGATKKTSTGGRYKVKSISGKSSLKVSGVVNPASGKDLASFIKSNKANANQRVKFLATAIWLNKNGNSNLVTRDVTRALKASHVPALINPSQYLNQNIKQGYLKKSGDHFLLTKKGATAL